MDSVLNAVPEIEQGLSDAAHSKITVSFTPHLMPMVIVALSIRGMQSTIYVEMAPGVTVEDLYQQLKISYKDEEFVKLLEKGDCSLALIMFEIDNLVKGASGQALQNLNIMLGFPENTGLLYQALFP
ncbi:hypothetical protein Patl1_36222 [Pistacia atlantica]|nr:hypothetical protein Patl1_36222 [Pistacia atlantica]